jgi:PAS domain S-box-containing protein
MKNQDNRSKEAVDSSAGSGQDLRQRAEALARERAVRTPEDSAALSPEEVRKTIHELRVHQIELEMQNEELRTAQAQIEAGRARYLDLYDLAPVGYCTLSEQGLILEANLTAATLLGTARGSLIKQPISRFILKEDQDIYYLHRKKLFETGAPQECELRMGKPDGTNFWAHLSATAAPVCRVVINDITERKRSESVLAFLAQSSPNPASGDFFQVLARYISETLDMGFVCIDRLDGDNLTAHTEAVYSNGRFEDNVSYALKDTPCGEVVGKQVCCFPASIKNLFPNDAVLQQMEAESYIGATLWSHDGRPIGLIAVVGARPMTNRPQAESLLRLVAVRAAAELERKQAEEALRQSGERFRAAFEHSAIGMALVSPEGNWLKVNKWVCDIVGYTADELMAKTFQDITHTEDLDTDLAFVRQMLAGEIESYQMEKRYFDKDGHIVWVLLTVSLVWDEQGAPLHFISQIQDITERKREQEAIRESELKFRTLVEASSSGIWKTDAAGHNTYVSPRWCEITGISEAAAAGQGWASGLHPDDRIPVHTGWMKAATASASYSAEFRFVHSDGRFVWVLCQASPVKAGDHVVEWIGTITDITERKQTEAEREKLQAQLTQAQKMESVGRLAGGVAHDFNNMLGVIIGHADMLLEHMDTNHPFHADLAEIRKAGARSADLTRQLLAFARKQTVAPKVLDLNETVESMLKLLQRLIGEDIDLLWKPGHGLWPVRMDPAQIDQILANLCVNARDAIAGVGKMIIETGNTVFDEAYREDHAGFVPGEYSMLAVSDDGCGMDSETLSHIFEPFFTTKELGKGTGLGLATVYGVVKQNDGFINAYSEPGQGTTFKIYLPRHRAKEGPLPDKEAIRPAEPGHETILLVEDEPAILRMTTMMLQREGYTVLEAGTPGEAIRLAIEHAGDLHLLMADVVMPEMNGRVLAKNILSLYPHLKCLFMSGYTANVIAHHGVLDEGVNFIQKPFSKGDLTIKVREVLDQD